jgi:hypothetical protein
MALIVLATICFFSCFFLLFVQIKWMRDTKRKTTTRVAVGRKGREKREQKQPRAIDSARAVEKRDRFKVATDRVTTTAGRSGNRESWRDEQERRAYERIARSFGCREEK